MRSAARETRLGGIDLVKLIAAMLVVAIHTGPLLSVDPYADFLLTGIVARLAVPFFFAASGFLFFRKLTGVRRKDDRAFRRYVWRIAGLYAAAIVFYLPVNVYKGDFAHGIDITAAVRAILIDGTFYHLWYLPALITGFCIVYHAQRRLPSSAVYPLVTLLYIIGLLGDSYYGLAARSDSLGAVYDWLFSWSDYTRNGLFFAPVYLAVGMYAAKMPASKPRRSRNLVLFLASAGALLLEGILLRDAEFPRHDSMYIMLLPAVYALLQLAAQAKIGGFRKAGAMSQWIYLLHPAVIVVVRGAAEAAGFRELAVDQSIMHYAAVCILSAAAAGGIEAVLSVRRRKQAVMNNAPFA
ncbi:acyltransferase [Paenibacillus nanensis]|uniref:Acyltransferase n=1 Tax=Paenibacillus nanensis TaxID=393251 RepID=A0A3A1URZ3_9BACL|nr:acyltransferase [Paenibacillus nanensis]RIX51005.1 acyltransferase [Paenibacillus nanensis]